MRTVWTDRSLSTRDARVELERHGPAAGNHVAPGTYRVVVWARSWVGTTWSARNVVVEAH